MYTDIVSDSVSSISVAALQKKAEVKLRYSKLLVDLLLHLRDHGVIGSFSVARNENIDVVTVVLRHNSTVKSSFKAYPRSSSAVSFKALKNFVFIKRGSGFLLLTSRDGCRSVFPKAMDVTSSDYHGGKVLMHVNYN